jgi:hypothetical protein
VYCFWILSNKLDLNQETHFTIHRQDLALKFASINAPFSPWWRHLETNRILWCKTWFERIALNALEIIFDSQKKLLKFEMTQAQTKSKPDHSKWWKINQNFDRLSIVIKLFSSSLLAKNNLPVQVTFFTVAFYMGGLLAMP